MTEKMSDSRSMHHLALRIRDIRQLFNSMDPTPFVNKNLDRDAEDYIESWAAGYPSESRFKITIHLEQRPQVGNPAAILSEAIHNHFSYKTDCMRNSLKQLFKQGRTSLIVGIVFLSLCLLGANTLSGMGKNPGYNIADQSLIIVGWVAMWRPLQIFLYDWWPLQRKIGLYKRLSNAIIKTIIEDKIVI